MTQSFIVYLQAEGFITPEDVLKCGDYSEGMLPEDEGGLLLDAGVFNQEELDDALFYYNMNAFLEENTIELPAEHTDDEFFTEYMRIVKHGFTNFLHVETKNGDMEIYSTVREEAIIYQSLMGHDKSPFITGIAGPEAYLTEAAAVLHKKFAEEMELPDFEPCREDMLDFYFELLNNINSSCSYMFNIEFDLSLPEYKENAELSAPQIYTAPFKYLDYTISFFLICGSAYAFKEEK